MSNDWKNAIGDFLKQTEDLAHVPAPPSSLGPHRTGMSTVISWGLFSEGSRFNRNKVSSARGLVPPLMKRS
jgi:hypothetical protein